MSGQSKAVSVKKTTVMSKLDMLSLPTTATYGPSTAPTLPIPNCTEKLPLFCHIEHKMSQSSGIPVRIRLGSVHYVDQLEGKN